jgi:ABC-type multidrug transport system fused ATPase/permease subunit
MNQFLNAKEIDRKYLSQGDEEGDQDLAIQIVNGDFKWKWTEEEEGLKSKDKNSKKKLKEKHVQVEDLQNEENLIAERQSNKKETDFRLEGINLSIKKSETVAIIGKSSSGKSSLLYSILGEMIPLDLTGETKSTIRGNYAYLSQTRWLLGSSVKENITLGKEVDEELMAEALKASALAMDVKNLPNGIDTILGDNGSTVSGGQRARIGLARCFYQK